MTSITSRKLDLVYLIFFLTHIPIVLAIDCYLLYPKALQTSWMTSLRQFYIATYQDQFFIKPPSWFRTYIFLELIYHLPLSLWAVRALWRDDPRVPLHLLVYAVETAVTTLTCIADFLSWSAFSNNQKIQLAYLYVPYLALSIFMGSDMFGRLNKLIKSRSVALKPKQM